MKILILCTGNSCRSQMAHGFVQAIDSSFQVFSGGTNPASQVNPKAILERAEAKSSKDLLLDKFTLRYFKYIDIATAPDWFKELES